MLFNIYKEVKIISFKIRDNAHKRRSTYIDTIVVMEELLEIIAWSKLTENNEIVELDYRGYALLICSYILRMRLKL